MRANADRSAVPRWPNWLGLVADDLDAARRFYGEALGLEPMDSGDHRVQFDLGGQRIFELLRRDADQVQYERPRFQPGFAVDDVRRAGERLRSLGAEQITKIEGGPEHGGWWCSFRDPQGPSSRSASSTRRRRGRPAGRDDASGSIAG